MNGRDRMLAAWDRFPGRSCSEQQWAAWMNAILRAVEAARKESDLEERGRAFQAVYDGGDVR